MIVFPAAFAVLAFSACSPKAESKAEDLKSAAAEMAADTKAVEGGKPVPALSVGRVKAFYDGTLFYQLAKARA